MINVGDKFKRQDLPIAKVNQPADYTAYPVGEKKIGIIPQDGLTKRKYDAVVYKTAIAVSSTVKGGTSPVAVDQAKVPSGVVFSGIEKFFSWLNKMIGV